MPSERMSPPLRPAHHGDEGIHPLELFFDLVFVFAVSQITHVVIEPHAWSDHLQAGLLLSTMLWIYTSFVMLSANLGLRDGELQRWILLAGMAVFFGISMGIPALTHGHPLVFTLFLGVATMIHPVHLLLAPGAAPRNRAAVPARLGIGAAVIAACFLPEPQRWILWSLAVAALLVLVGRLDVFRVHAAHLCERLGLAVIITLGEGVMQTGATVQDHLSVARVLGAFGVLLLLAVMWWIYFGLNASGFTRALTRAGGERSAEAFAMSHLPVLGGIILVSAAASRMLEEPLRHTPHTAAWNLAGGVALYLLGIALLRQLTDQPQQKGFFLAALFCPAVALLGTTTNSAVMLVVAIVCGLVIGFGYAPRKHRPTAA